MVCYEGIFFDKETSELILTLDPQKLNRTINNLHCTFRFRPTDDEIYDDIVGKSFEIYLIGYGNDGQNSGFEILIPNDLKKYYINYDDQDAKILRTPHITTSLADGAKAVNTKNLNFKPLKKPIKIVGRFGYWIIEENKEYLSYEKYANIKKK